MAVDDEWEGTGYWGGLSWKRNAPLSGYQRSPVGWGGSRPRCSQESCEQYRYS